MGDQSDPPPSTIAQVDRFPPVMIQQSELAKKSSIETGDSKHNFSLKRCIGLHIYLIRAIIVKKNFTA